MTPTQHKHLGSDIRVGLVTFTAIGLLVAGIILAGGDKGLFLRETVEVKARLSDVGGLKRGSSVSMSGMVIGKVTDIEFLKNEEVNPIEVTMELRADVRESVQAHAVPTVRTQGMMGDRYIDIPIPTVAGPILPDRGVLIGQAATDFDETLREALSVLREAKKLFQAINNQQGTIGELFYDEALYKNLVTMTEELNELVRDFKAKPKKYVKLSIF